MNTDDLIKALLPHIQAMEDVITQFTDETGVLVECHIPKAVGHRMAIQNIEFHFSGVMRVPAPKKDS